MYIFRYQFEKRIIAFIALIVQRESIIELY